MALKDELGAVYKPGEKTVEMKVLLYSLILALGSEIILTLINIIKGVSTIVQRSRAKENKIEQGSHSKNKRATQKVQIRSKKFIAIRSKPSERINADMPNIFERKNKKLRKKLRLN